MMFLFKQHIIFFTNVITFNIKVQKLHTPNQIAANKILTNRMIFSSAIAVSSLIYHLNLYRVLSVLRLHSIGTVLNRRSPDIPKQKLFFTSPCHGKFILVCGNMPLILAPTSFKSAHLDVI